MSHQVFVDKMLSVLSTPMVFLKESSFVFASNGRRWHWCLCSRGALTASLFARSKQEHPTPNKNTLPEQEHLPRTRTPCPNKDTLLKRQPRSNKNIQPRTRTPCPNKDTLLKPQPRSNEDTPPEQGHPAETRTPRPNQDTPHERGHPARTRTPARTKRFGKFLLNLPG